jgi:hypothetical protein
MKNSSTAEELAMAIPMVLHMAKRQFVKRFETL